MPLDVIAGLPIVYPVSLKYLPYGVSSGKLTWHAMHS